MRVDLIREGDEVRPDLPEGTSYRIVGEYDEDGLIDPGPWTEHSYEEIVGYDEEGEPITETRTRMVPPQWPPLVEDDEGNMVPGPYPEVVAFEVEIITPTSERLNNVETRLNSVAALADRANATAQEVAQAARDRNEPPGKKP